MRHYPNLILVLNPEEDMLVHQIAGLISVSDKERDLARQRALAKLSKDKHELSLVTRIS